MKKTQKLALLIAILASFVAFLDGSVVNVALPAISGELGGGLSTQQWVVDAYLITLGACILIAGSMSDIFGRKRVLVAGTVGFGVTSLLCAVAPTAPTLIIARALQGLAGALLVPSSLALIMSVYAGAEQGKAIGRWTAWTGIAFVVGPLVGGTMVDVLSWRLVFAINVVPIAVVLWLARKLELPAHKAAARKVDVPGALLGAAALGLPVYGLIEQPNYGWGSPRIWVPLLAGAVLTAVFLWHERRTAQPMLPLGIFHNRNFAVGNLATAAVYGGLGLMTFLLAVFLQQIAGYSALEAGLSLLPITIIMFFLSPRFGAMSGRLGPRLFMGIGPVISGLAALLFLRTGASAAYLTEVFPAVVVFGVGLAVTVAPLTAAILGAVDEERAGIASAINNAVARIAGLVAVAFLGLLAGSALTLDGFREAMLLTAVLLLLGGVISGIGIQNPKRIPDPVAEPA
jgi:EmrB/QacA subfamily drug resistance transporter